MVCLQPAIGAFALQAFLKPLSYEEQYPVSHKIAVQLIDHFKTLYIKLHHIISAFRVLFQKIRGLPAESGTVIKPSEGIMLQQVSQLLIFLFYEKFVLPALRHVNIYNTVNGDSVLLLVFQRIQTQPSKAFVLSPHLMDHGDSFIAVLIFPEPPKNIFRITANPQSSQVLAESLLKLLPVITELAAEPVIKILHLHLICHLPDTNTARDRINQGIQLISGLKKGILKSFPLQNMLYHNILHTFFHHHGPVRLVDKIIRSEYQRVLL